MTNYRSTLLRALGLLVFSATLNAGELRTWTDDQGREVEAGFGGVKGDSIVFEMPNGTTLEFPIAKLSDADKKWVEENKTAAAAKPAGDPHDHNPRAQPGGRQRVNRGDGPKAETQWPDKVDLDSTPEVEVVKEDGDAKEYVYRTEHYEFHSDIRLSKSVVREFGRIFEATYLLNCKLPLDLAPHVEDGQEYFEAQIFETRDAYMKAGGWPGSGGVYMSSIKKFLVPITSLGVVNRGSRVTIDYDYRDFTTLIHEITHQMMNQWLGYLPVWYSEGSAVYAEMLDYKNGKFDLSNTKSIMRDHVGGRDAKMLDPEVLFNMSNEVWNNTLKSGNSKLNYDSAGMLAFYFYHLDGDGDAANIIKCLRNIEASVKPWEESQKELLIRGRSMDEFRTELKTKFKDELNIDLKFVGGSGETTGG